MANMLSGPQQLKALLPAVKSDSGVMTVHEF
ncbi:hypothetical protein EPYR_02108 [Erwinia pyrifoliae DSM 12163]|nr:hypothetical protein EPYR_02108 [Erwinia pyrifoliae DSM 12163]